VPSGSAVFIRLLIEELGTPELAQIFAYGKWLYPYRMLSHGASDLDQRCLKRAIIRMDVPIHQISSFLFPNSPKLHFGDLTMQNLLYRKLPVSHMLMELRSIGKLGGLSKFFR